MVRCNAAVAVGSTCQSTEPGEIRGMQFGLRTAKPPASTFSSGSTINFVSIMKLININNLEIKSRSDQL